MHAAGASRSLFNPHQGASLDLHETARRLGAYAWVEARAFEVLGSWVPSVPEAAAKVCIAAHSRAHGWHAGVWTAVLPRTADLDVDELVTAPSSGLEAFFDALDASGGGTIERLAGAFRVLVPRLVAAYRAHLSIVTPASDGATARWLRIVLADEIEHWREGEAILQSLLVDPGAARRAAEVQGELEAALVGAGGLLGGR